MQRKMVLKMPSTLLCQSAWTKKCPNQSFNQSTSFILAYSTNLDQATMQIESIVLTQPAFKFDSHERVLAYLLDKLTDPRLASKVEEVFFRYLDQRKPDYFNLVAFVVSKNSYFNVQTQNSHKLLQKKLQVLHKMTELINQQELPQASPNPKGGRHSVMSQQQQGGYPYQEVFFKLLKTIDHPTNEIRNVSIKIVMEIYQRMGFEKVRDFIAKLPMKILQSTFVKIMPEAEPYLKMTQEQIKAANKTNAYGGGGKIGWAPNLMATKHIEEGEVTVNKKAKKAESPPKRQAKKAPPTKQDQAKKENAANAKCQFCGIKSASFAEGDNLDNHFLNQCLMLTNCSGCGQIVEISSLNAHYLKECTEKEQYKRCRTCKESFPKDAIDAHQSEAKCNAQKPTSQANRCPLCHKDIGPLDKGWKDHLLSKQCKKNERNNGGQMLLGTVKKETDQTITIEQREESAIGKIGPSIKVM